MIGKPRAGALINRAHPLARGIALLVPFSEGAGTGFRDLVGKTAIAPTSVAWGGQGGRFNGSTSRLRLTSNAKLSGTGSHTITAVVKIGTANTGAFREIFLKGSDASGAGWGFTLQIDPSNLAKASAVTSGTQSGISGTTVMTPGKRFVLHASFHSPSKALKIWVNGALEGTTTTVGNSLRYANDSIIGGYYNGSYSSLVDQFSGDIEMIVLRTHAMSATDIRLEAADPYAAWTETPRRYLSTRTGKVRVKVGGTFAAKNVAVKIGGAFVNKPVSVKVGGSFILAN